MTRRATSQRKARGGTGSNRPHLRRNLWPFSAFKTSTTYHVKRKRGPTTAGAGSFKGHRIERLPDGGFTVPSLDRESVFDDKRQAKRFITAQTKYNNAARKNSQPVMTYQLAHAAATDAANKAMRKAGRTSWNKADYNVAVRTFKKLFKANPGKHAFARCVAKVSQRPEVVSPAGVCAAAGRKKYGAKKFAAMARAGKRAAARNPGLRIVALNESRYNRDIRHLLRDPSQTYAEYSRNYPGRMWMLYRGSEFIRTSASKAELKGYGRENSGKQKNCGALRQPKHSNPVEAAKEVYEKFHGRPAAKILKITERVHVHTALSGIGDLKRLTVRHIGGRKKTDLDFGPGAVLAQNEKRNQLFIRGGDQSVPLAVFGIKPPYHESEILGEVLSVDYFTRKDHLAPKDGGTATYRHKFGRKKPTLIYSVPDKKLSFAGGGYTIPDEGIDL